VFPIFNSQKIDIFRQISKQKNLDSIHILQNGIRFYYEIEHEIKIEERYLEWNNIKLPFPI
jgi:hypothetical protein